MNYQDAVWKSICYIANNNIASPRPAKKYGLYTTAFRFCKRHSVRGQPRCISTATLAKILSDLKITPMQFAEIVQRFMNNE